MYATVNTNGLVGTFMIMWAITMLAVSVTLVLMVLSIIHVLQHQDVKHRWLWLAAIILLPLIGAAIYFLVVLIPYNREHPYIPPKTK